VSELDGIGRAMPFTMTAFFVASLSIIGLPPLGGSWSKWYLAVGAANAEQPIFVAVLMLSSLLSVGYLLPIVARAFYPAGRANSKPLSRREAPALCVVPICLTALGCLVLFVFADQLQSWLAPIGGIR
jgi:multicomponent Na+:H+ antiporter subunit D